MAGFDLPEDFLENEQFIAWMRSPDSNSDAYWVQWLEQNPAKRPQFELAVATMLSIKGKEPERSEEYINGKIADLRAELLTKTRRPVIRPVFRWSAIAASIAILFVVGLSVFHHHFSEIGMRHAVETLPVPQIKTFVNTNSQPLLVNLPDGSSVVLSKDSRLEYQNLNGAFPRVVRLVGDGFFEITKDPKHPFSVQTEHLTARVLGTSFLVRSFTNEAKAIVSVRTGSVSVSTVKKTNSAPNQADVPVLVRQNEQLSLVVATEEMFRETVSGREQNAIPELLQGSNYVFHLKPVSEIFDLLEKAYGIPIEYDANKLRNRTLSASLTDEPFLDKIRMICIGIEADFQIEENRVVITSPNLLPSPMTKKTGQ